jgi:hypothetical protein
VNNFSPFHPLRFSGTGVKWLWADMDVGCSDSTPVNPANRCQPVLFAFSSSCPMFWAFDGKVERAVLLLGFPPDFVL